MVNTDYAVKLTGTETGFYLADFTNHQFIVTTRNTVYTFTSRDGKLTGIAKKPDGSQPRYLAFEMPVTVSGSTWGGSMLKVGYIGVGMHLEFNHDGREPWRTIRTSEIQIVQVIPLNTHSAQHA